MKKSILFGMILIVCVIIVTFVFSQFYPGGMVSYWKFDEGEGTIAYDSVDANDGTLVNGPVWTSGQVGGALNFDGVDDYIDTGYKHNQNTGTINYWFKLPYVGTNQLIGHNDGTTRRFYLGYSDSTNLYAGFGGTGYTNAHLANPLQADTWYMITLTGDGSTGRIYLNGSFVDNFSYTFSGASSINFHIGESNHASYVSWFNGIIDEVAIFDRALTEGEIQQFYQNGLNGVGYEVECIPAPYGLVSWWTGDGNAYDFWDANHGMEISGATYAPGMVGQAFSFNGSSYVSVPDDASLTLGDAFTLDLWANFNYVSGRQPFIGHDEGGGHTNKWIFWYDSYGHRPPYGPGLRFHLVSMNPSHHGDPVVYLWNPIPRKWYHVAITKSGSTYALYIDGTRVINETYNQPIPDVNYPLTIGRAESFRFAGLIDEVEIFHRALSEEEIQAIYIAGSAGKCKVRTVTIDIKPGSYPNSINLGSNGNVPVAIFSAEDFDATTVAPLTVRLSGAEVRIKGKGDPQVNFDDVDGDGLMDIVVHVDTQSFVLSATDTEAILTGETFDGVKFEGVDTVRIVN